MTTLYYDKGTIVVDSDFKIPNTRYDERTKKYRALAMYYRDILSFLERSGIPYEERVLDLVPAPFFEAGLELRDYQSRALECWLAEKQGVVVLPTGAGKTHVALAAINQLKCATLVVVPTLDLVKQWKKHLAIFYKKAKAGGEVKGGSEAEDIGEFTGDQKVLKPLTVATYDSAFINAEYLGNKFKLIVFDEVHHLPSEGYRHIAEFSAAPYRMGLTATYEREDGQHILLPELVGGKIFEMGAKDLAGKHLSKFTLERIRVTLTEEERAEYLKNQKKFQHYIITHNVRMNTPYDFQKLIIRSGNDPKAREAVLAKNEANRIAFNSSNKIKELRNLLRIHKNDRIIIFTRLNDLVYRISDKFFIPFITYKSNKEERSRILSKFRSGEYSAVVTSQVLDEGIDVPDANVGIIMSGTSSSREFIQRLGRLLRPSKKKAILYEVVTAETTEMRKSYKRSARVRKEKENAD